MQIVFLVACLESRGTRHASRHAGLRFFQSMKKVVARDPGLTPGATDMPPAFAGWSRWKWKGSTIGASVFCMHPCRSIRSATVRIDAKRSCQPPSDVSAGDIPVRVSEDIPNTQSQKLIKGKDKEGSSRSLSIVALA